MTGDRTNYIEIDLLQLLKTLRRRVWAILLATVLFGGAAFTYATVFITPRYQASALMYVNNSSFSLGSTSFSISSSELTAAQSLVGTYIVILNTRTTLEDVIQKAGVSYTYEELSGMVNASAVNATEIFEVTVTSEDPQEAELIANTIAEVLPGKISDVVEGSSVRVVDYAVVPAGKASPNITMYTAIGIMLGLAISCFAVILLAVFDDLIHSEEYLAQTYDVPVLAVIPDLLETSGDSYYRHGGYYQRIDKGGESDAAN